MKDLLLRARFSVTTSNLNISRRRLSDYVKEMYVKGSIIFPDSTNHITDLYRHHCHFLNSPLKGDK